jgi:hypothetical protein
VLYHIGSSTDEYKIIIAAVMYLHITHIMEVLKRWQQRSYENKVGRCHYRADKMAAKICLSLRTASCMDPVTAITNMAEFLFSY